MLLQHKIGRLADFDLTGKMVDAIQIEWYETRKRILRKTTLSGKEVSIKFLNENPDLTDGDVLFADDAIIITVTILPCECIVIQPNTMFEMATICYEIGNKHLPLFYEADQLLVPFEMPLYKLLMAQGYPVLQEKRQLLQPLKTTVSPHETSNNQSLFSKIMKLTTPTA